jgi:1,2-diacylglycerol 3-beta-glucosyltransferase
MRRLRGAAWSLCLAVLAWCSASAISLEGAIAADGQGRDITVSRVDVSRPGTVGAVLALPPGTTATERVVVTARSQVGSVSTPAPAQVKRLSPQDLEVVLVPETDAAADIVAAERAALSRLVAALPARARAAVFDGDPQAPVPEGSGTKASEPGRPPSAAAELSEDPARAIVAVAGLASRRTYATAGEKLEAALAQLSPGPTVRRTLVLVTSRSGPEPAGVVDHLRRRLLASGTQLFVVDLASTPSALDALAADSGGWATRPGIAPTTSGSLAAFAADVVDGLDRQVYVRFRDSERLPATVTLEVTVGGEVYRTRVDLPAANPVAPSPWVFSPVSAVPAETSRVDLLLLGLSAALVLSSLAYGAWMLVASFREPRGRAPRRLDLPRIWDKSAGTGTSAFFVFLLPCLNEDKVIRASIDRLLSIPGDNYAVMVIDDGSEDATADVARAMTGPRVWLLRRTAPNARQGKGEALNAAIRELVGAELLRGRDHHDVVVVVVDADGRLDPRAVAAVTPSFEDPSIGAVQIGVRINNRFTSRLARMQDMEFVIFTQVFQRGRRHLGSVGMGGNGQFMRLSALLSLGPEPWSRSLTEDLDLGVRLLSQGWRNEFCSSVAVHQQGVEQVRKLVRQRTRWFQGHIQSWGLVPIILRTTPSPARADLLYHLSSPALLLVASLLTASFLVSMVGSVLLAIGGVSPWSPWLLSAYILAFGPSCAYGYVYWRCERSEGASLLRVLGWSHLYVAYGLMWYAAGWRAVGRVLRRQTGWAKTERSAEPVVDARLVGGVVPQAVDSPADSRPPAVPPAREETAGAEDETPELVEERTQQHSRPGDGSVASSVPEGGMLNGSYPVADVVPAASDRFALEAGATAGSHEASVSRLDALAAGVDASTRDTANLEVVVGRQASAMPPKMPDPPPPTPAEASAQPRGAQQVDLVDDNGDPPAEIELRTSEVAW